MTQVDLVADAIEPELDWPTRSPARAPAGGAIAVRLGQPSAGAGLAFPAGCVSGRLPRQTAASHRRWFKDVLGDMMAPLGLTDPAGTADQLVMLRDGAMVSGYLGDPATVSRSLGRAARAVIGPRRQAP